MSNDGPLGALSALINRAIAQSETAQRDLAAVEGRSLAVRVEGLPLTLHFIAARGALEVRSAQDGAPAARITGTPLALLSLLTGEQPDAQAARELGIQLDGDEDVAAAFSRLLRRARPDLEEELSNVIGDVAAHQVGTALRTLRDLGERTWDTLRQNTGEFLQHESRVVPSRIEVRGFCDDVDRLRDDVERAAARLRQLEKQNPGTGE